MGNMDVYGKLEREAVARVKIPPICYFPPVWEIVINSKINPAELEEFAEVLSSQDPVPPAPRAIASYMKNRINMVENLVNKGKLDSKLGDMAISHFKAHIKDAGAKL